MASVCLADDGAPADSTASPIVISNVYAWKGDQLLREGRLDSATESYLKASGFMRTSPVPHFRLAKIYLRTSLMDSFLEFATGLQLLISDFFYQSLVVSNLLVILFLAAGAGIYVAVLIIVFRHARTVWFATVISLPERLKGRYPSIIIIASLLAFFVLLSGRSLIGIVTWTAMVGCGLLWRFASSSDKRTVIGFVIFLAVFGFLFESTGLIVSTQHPDSALRLAAMADVVGEDNLERAFGQRRQTAIYEPINEFMRGLLYLRAHDYAPAIGHFNLAAKYAPDNAAILNNLGVAHHGLGQYRRAMARFQDALKVGPREALIHYNYAQTLNALLHYEIAQEELAKASTLDFDLTRSLITQQETSSLVPMNLQTRVLWQLALDDDSRILRLDYHPVESGSVGTLILVALTILAAVLIRKARCPARCEICGCGVTVPVTRRKRKDVLCRDCQAIKVRFANDHDQLEHRIRHKLARLRLSRTVLRVLAGLFVFGSAHHLSGKRLRGFMTSVAMFSLLVLALSDGALIQPVPQLRLDPIGSWALPAFILAYAIYAWRSTVIAIRSVKESAG